MEKPPGGIHSRQVNTPGGFNIRGLEPKMSEEEVRIELDKVVSSLNESGFGAVSIEVSTRLEQLKTSADEWGMKEGSHLINNLITVIRDIRDGKSKPESGKIRLIALEFYLMKFKGSEITIDL